MLKFDFKSFQQHKILSNREMADLLNIEAISYFYYVKKRGTLKPASIRQLSEKYEDIKKYVS